MIVIWGNALINAFASFGYNKVNPPLIKFEDSLLSGNGLQHSNKTFHGQLGRGDGYVLDETNEPSVDFSLYSDTLLSTITPDNITERIYAGYNEDRNVVKNLRKTGKIVICELDSHKNSKQSAIDIGCTHMLINGK